MALWAATSLSCAAQPAGLVEVHQVSEVAISSGAENEAGKDLKKCQAWPALVAIETTSWKAEITHASRQGAQSNTRERVETLGKESGVR